MGQPLRVVHYINQFFAGMGGEDMANVGVSLTPGTTGASRALQQTLAENGSVIARATEPHSHCGIRSSRIPSEIDSPIPRIAVIRPATTHG